MKRLMIAILPLLYAAAAPAATQALERELQTSQKLLAESSKKQAEIQQTQLGAQQALEQAILQVSILEKENQQLKAENVTLKQRVEDCKRDCEERIGLITKQFDVHIG